MFSIVLVEPKIPPNTGNIIRLCANAGCHLHLVGPLGFELETKQLRRAGLDYHDLALLTQHADWSAFYTQYRQQDKNGRLIAYSTRHQRLYSEYAYASDDYLIFGSETAGLSSSVLACIEQDNRLTIPMVADSRSLNLSNSVALVAYEGWRQLGFRNAANA